MDVGIVHTADPQETLPVQINTNHDGWGVYFRDPVGHGLEIITHPYGSAGELPAGAIVEAPGPQEFPVATGGA